jgi:hypothetical protein
MFYFHYTISKDACLFAEFGLLLKVPKSLLLTIGYDDRENFENCCEELIYRLENDLQNYFIKDNF